MKNISALLLFFALFAGSNLYAQKGWFQQSGPATDTVWYSVGLIDVQTGNIVGQDGLMLRTTNGGKVWSFMNSGVSKTLFKVRFFDNSFGIAVGNSGSIVITTNGGASWSPVNSGTTKALYDIAIKSATDWIVVGNGGLIRRTTDGGGSWKDDTQGINNLWSIALAPNKLLGITVGNMDTEYATTDGGKNWISIDIGAITTVHGVAFLTDSTIVAVGAAGSMYYSSNKGGKWKQGMANVPLSQEFQDVCAAGPNIGFAVGWGGTLIATYDGGANWTAQDASVGYNLQGICFVDQNTGNACGWSNSVIRTTTGGLVPASPVAALPSQPILGQNYPNPFHRDAQTMISFTLPAASRTTLKVYTIFGAEVATLYDGVLAAGVQRVLWNANDIPCGVYFYRLTAGEYSVTKQLVFLK